MGIAKVYVDECGHTGGNLLDPRQPVFAMSAVVEKPDGIEAFRNKFSKVQGFDKNEIKHARLIKHHKSELIEAQRLLLDEMNGVVFVTNKRYSCIEAFIMDCVRPVFPEQFASGSIDSQRLALMLFYYSAQIVGDEFEKLLQVYNDACNKVNEKFGYLLSTARGITSEKLKPLVLGLCEKRRAVLSQFAHCPLPQLQVGGLLALITQLETQLDRPYEIIYDEAKDIRNSIDTFNAFINNQCGTIRVADGVELTFPLKKFVGMREASSKIETGLSMADVLCGGACAMGQTQWPLKGLKPSAYGLEVLELYKQAPDNRLLVKPSNKIMDLSVDMARLIIGMS